MSKEFKKITSKTETRYVLETASVGATSSGAVATAPSNLKMLQRRLAELKQRVSVPTAKPRNPVGMGDKPGRGTQKHEPNQRQKSRDDKKLGMAEGRLSQIQSQAMALSRKANAVGVGKEWAHMLKTGSTKEINAALDLAWDRADSAAMTGLMTSLQEIVNYLSGESNYLPSNTKEQRVAEGDDTPGYIKYEQMKDKIASVLIKLYDQGKDEETIKQFGSRVAQHLGYDPEDPMYQQAWMSSLTDASLDGSLDGEPEDDYTDYTMRQGEKGVAEGPVKKVPSHAELAKSAWEAAIQATRLGNSVMADHYAKQYEKHKRLAASEKKSIEKGMAEDNLSELKRPSGFMFLKFRVKKLPDDEQAVVAYGGFGNTPKEVTVQNSKIKPFDAEDQGHLLKTVRALLNDKQFVGIQKLFLDIPDQLMGVDSIKSLLNYAERDERIQLHQTDDQDDDQEASGGKSVGYMIDPLTGKRKKIDRSKPQAQVAGSGRGVEQSAPDVMVTGNSPMAKKFLDQRMGQYRYGPGFKLPDSVYKKMLSTVGNTEFQKNFSVKKLAEQGVAEGPDKKVPSHAELAKSAWAAAIQATRLGNSVMADHYAKQYEKHKRLAASEKKSIEKGMAEGDQESDHEISMASSELQSIAKDAADLLDMVRQRSEEEGLMAWQQSKITKAADYMNSVLQSLSGDEGVAEGLGDTKTEVIGKYKGWTFTIDTQTEDDRYVRFYGAISPDGKEHQLPKHTTADQFKQFVDRQGVAEGLRDPKDNPCWKGYKPVGTKKKGGRTVPNCVPVKEDVYFEQLTQQLQSKLGE